MSEPQTVRLNYDDGARAVELARDAIESYVLHGQREHPGSMRDAFYQRTGALVRIESTRGRRSLRGCSGTVQGSEQLGHAIVDAAITAASDDSCGSEVGSAELDSLVVSTCIVCDVLLTDNPLRDLEVGRHGVAVDAGDRGGWLYPTVPAEHGWSPREYLERTCRKAGLAPNAWEDDGTMALLFEGRVFRERDPGGSIEHLG